MVNTPGTGSEPEKPSPNSSDVLPEPAKASVKPSEHFLLNTLKTKKRILGDLNSRINLINGLLDVSVYSFLRDGLPLDLVFQKKTKEWASEASHFSKGEA